VTGVEQEVIEAATALVEAFAADDTDAYFGCFAADATFVFHSTPERLDDRAAYEALWRRWVAEDGFAVVSCRSSGRRVQVLGPDAAVLVHDVSTVVRVGGAEERLEERETIVFARREGVWTAVHEHLSPRPVATG
jgi:uncharacterized protein (TIGR02246 family)